MKSKKKVEVKSRKELRKEFRKNKKAKKNQYYSVKKADKIKSWSQYTNESWSAQNTEQETTKQKKKAVQNFEKPVKQKNSKKNFTNLQDEQRYESLKEKMEAEKLGKEMKLSKIEKLKEDNVEEDKEIKRLEKQLKLNKRKTKSLAKLFSSDGLDYLLEICDKKPTERQTFEDSDSDFETDLANVTGKNEIKQKKIHQNETLSDTQSDEEPKNKKKSMKKVTFAVDTNEKSSNKKRKDKTPRKAQLLDDDDFSLESNESSLEENDVEIDSEESDFEMDSEEDGEIVPEDNNEIEEEEIIDNNNCESGDSDENSSKKEDKSELWEDIYGRKRDREGNVVAAYKPPQLRKVQDAESEKVIKLKKQLKGLLNRLAENNMAGISTQIEDLYMKNSRNDMNESLCSLMMETLNTPVLTPERLVTEQAMLVAILHANVGSEVGAHFLQHMVSCLVNLLNENMEIEDKRMNNLVLFVCSLYNFKLVQSDLMYDLINRVLEKPEEKEIELLLVFLRSVGFTLRKADPVRLKSLVLKVHEVANTAAAAETNQSSRMKFMLDVMLAVKNNNMSKIPNYDAETVERLKKNLRVLIRKGNMTSELNITLQDLLNVEKHGRWWVVGSAWSGTGPTTADKDTKEPAAAVPGGTFSEKLLQLAKKQRMNTDVRKSVFCILMSAEDYMDAFEKLMRLKLKGAVEREVMNVLLHCATQEKRFNPFYYHLALKYCTVDRKYQMMLQYAVWDRLKELKSLAPFQVANLAKLLANIILNKGLAISVLKVLEFSEMDKPAVRLIRQLLLSLLLSSEDDDAVSAVFLRVAASKELKLFREGLRLFLHHFVLRNRKHVQEEDLVVLQKRIKLADKALSGGHTRGLF